MAKARNKMSNGGIPSDPESDRYDPGRSGPAYSKGSQGALQEALRSKQAEGSRKDPSVNVGQGPTPARAQEWEENRQWREMHPQSGAEDYKRGGRAKNTSQWGRETARERYACGGMADGGTTAPDFNPSGPFGQAATDRREWEAMKARQAASQTKTSS